MATAAPAWKSVNPRWAGKQKIQAQISGSFELVLTDELPNGPYGEISMLGGKVYVAPGSSYDDVAAPLIAAWIKARGSTMTGKGGAELRGNQRKFQEVEAPFPGRIRAYPTTGHIDGRFSRRCQVRVHRGVDDRVPRVRGRP